MMGISDAIRPVVNDDPAVEFFAQLPPEARLCCLGGVAAAARQRSEHRSICPPLFDQKDRLGVQDERFHAPPESARPTHW